MVHRACWLCGVAVIAALLGAGEAPKAKAKASNGAAWFARSTGVTLPPGFVDTKIAGGLTGVTALAVAPDGRVFVCEQAGALRVIREDRLLERPFVTLKVDSYWERGLIGVAIDPEFTRNGYVYVNHVAADPFPHHRVSRFTADGDTARPGSEVVIFEGDDQNATAGAQQKAGHQGGAIHFGGDGKLYIALGEQTAGKPAQDMHTLLGKLLRINADGSIPSDNPFYATAEGKYRAIWALGLRNPFCFAVQPGSGRIFINDVGGKFEEINEGAPGRNFGWPVVEHGPTSDPRFTGPVHWYAVNSITGGAFCPVSGGAGAFPERWRGRYFFADFKQGWVRVLDPDRPAVVEDFAAGLSRPVDMAFGPDGSLYYADRDMWVNDKAFKPGTGAVHRVRFTGESGAVAAWRVAPGLSVSVRAADLPGLLSATGVLTSRAMTPYDVNVPHWADGANLRHWVAPPEGSGIGFDSQAGFKLPAGTVLVQQLDLGGRRVETRLLVITAVSQGYAANYRWRPDGSDADIVTTPGSSEEIAGRRWTYLSRDECMVCHNPQAGVALGLTARQLHRDAQLGGLSAAGLFTTPPTSREVAGIDRLRPLADTAAPLETRVRSYLDANCSQCHRPGGNIPSQFDARFTTPLEQQMLLNQPTLTDPLAIGQPKVIAPGDPQHSMIFRRLTQAELFRMPPVGRTVIDTQAAAAFKQWIESLKP